jgi:hypothetical protein
MREILNIQWFHLKASPLKAQILIASILLSVLYKVEMNHGIKFSNKWEKDIY